MISHIIKKETMSLVSKTDFYAGAIRGTYEFLRGRGYSTIVKEYAGQVVASQVGRLVAANLVDVTTVAWGLSSTIAASGVTGGVISMMWNRKYPKVEAFLVSSGVSALAFLTVGQVVSD